MANRYEKYIVPGRTPTGGGGGGGRSPEDYGVPGLDDATLEYLAKLGGEKGRFAAQELSQRKGIFSQANIYKNAYLQGLGPQFTQGLSAINSRLAGMGPMADSGGAIALRQRLASQIYGQAQRGYADYLGNALGEKRRNAYQMALAKASQPKQHWYDQALPVAGGIAAAALA